MKKLFITLICISLVFGGRRKVVMTPPAEVAGKFQTNIDWTVSDDFNDLDMSKWVKRADKGDPSKPAGNIKSSHNQIRKEGKTTYLSLLSSEEGEAGISALNPHMYGFTVCRWRLEGIEYGEKMAAHPAIWSFSYNMGSVPKNTPHPNPSNYTIEIDWMEYIKWQTIPGYHARVIPSTGRSDISRSCYMFQNRTDFDYWKIHGYEFTPEGIQMWEYVFKKWKKLGQPVVFGDKENVPGNVIEKKYRAYQYFVLSNIKFVEESYNLNPVRLDIDYLHHYKFREQGSGNGDQ